MISNINIKPLRIWNSLPTRWRTHKGESYQTLSPERHYEDGWRKVVKPDLTENQRLGELFVDEPNDEVSYKVVDLPEEVIKINIETQRQSRQLEILQLEKERQALAPFQAIQDEKEAYKVKEVYDPWDENFDYLTVLKDHKVTRILKNEKGELELVLFFLIIPHTPAVGDPSFLPENAPALWSRVVIGANGYEAWTQPTGGDGKYKWSAVVTHKNRIWRNDHDPAGTKDPLSIAWLNVWEPGEFVGWTDIGAAPK